MKLKQAYFTLVHHQSLRQIASRITDDTDAKIILGLFVENAVFLCTS